VRQSHNGQRLPAKFANISKINFNFMLANPPNPLNSSVSLNHKPEANLTASVNFQPMRQVNRQGAKHPSVQSFPIRWRKEAKWRGKIEVKHIGKSIPSLERTYQHAQGFKQSFMSWRVAHPPMVGWLWLSESTAIIHRLAEAVKEKYIIATKLR
jgi:hypothetical protein